MVRAVERLTFSNAYFSSEGGPQQTTTIFAEDARLLLHMQMQQ